MVEIIIKEHTLLFGLTMSGNFNRHKDKLCGGIGSIKETSLITQTALFCNFTIRDNGAFYSGTSF